MLHNLGMVIAQLECKQVLFLLFLEHLDLPRAEGVHDGGEDDQEDTTTGTKTEDLVQVSTFSDLGRLMGIGSAYLGQETLVEGTETLLSEDGDDTRPGPVVLGNLAGDLGGVLNSALDDVHGSVENGTDGATDGTGDEVVGHLAALVLGLGEHLADLEDAAKVTGIPEDVAPHGGLETLVHGEDALAADGLDDAVNHALVLARRGLVLETNLDELKGDNDERLGGTSGGASEDREGLVHLADAKHLAVDLAPFVVGGKLGGTLGSLHEDGGGDAAVEAGEARHHVSTRVVRSGSVAVVASRRTLHS